MEKIEGELLERLQDLTMTFSREITALQQSMIDLEAQVLELQARIGGGKNDYYN